MEPGAHRAVRVSHTLARAASAGVALVALAAPACTREAPPAAPSAPSAATPASSAAPAPAVALPGAPTEANGALFRVGTPRFPLGTPPRHLAFSADGKRLAGCGINGLVAVWELATGRVLARPAMGGWTCDALTWTAGDAAIAVAGSAFEASSSTVVTFDAGSGARLASLELHGEVVSLGPGSGSGLWIAGRDGVRLWAAGEAKPPLLALDGPWRVRAAEQRGELFAYGDYGSGVAVRALAKKPSICRFALDPDELAIAADGAQLAIALSGGGVQRFALPGCAPIDNQPKLRARALSFAGDGALLTVSEDGESWALHRWPVPAGNGAAVAETVVRVPRVDHEPVAFSQDGRWIAVARAMGAEVFDTATGRPSFEPTHRALITGVSVWDDGTVITVSDDSAWRFRDLGRTGTPFDVGTHGAAINADGDLLARTVKDGGETLVEIVDLARGSTLRRLEDRPVDEVFAWAGPNLMTRRKLAAATLDPKGNVLDTTSLHGFSRPFASDDGDTMVVAVNGTLVNRLRVHVKGAIVADAEDDERSGHVAGMAIGRARLFVVYGKLTGRRHELAGSAALVYPLPDLAATTDSVNAKHAVGERITDVSAVTLAPGERVFVGYVDGRVAPLGGEPGAAFKSGAGWVTALDVSPDGQLLASAHADGFIHVWRLGATH